jgi:hypothetical protein
LKKGVDVVQTQTVFVPHKIRSQNEFQYAHWRKYKAYADSWKSAMSRLLGRRKDREGEFRLVKITSIRKRMLDMGNLIGGAKPIPDALVLLGWLHDDAPKWCEIKYEQRKPLPSAECGTVIEIVGDRL